MYCSFTTHYREYNFELHWYCKNVMQSQTFWTVQKALKLPKLYNALFAFVFGRKFILVEKLYTKMYNLFYNDNCKKY